MTFDFIFERTAGETQEAFRDRAEAGLALIDALDAEGENRVFRGSCVDLEDGWQRTTIIVEHKPA